MKSKIIQISVLGLAALGLAACGGGTNPASSVVSSETPSVSSEESSEASVFSGYSATVTMPDGSPATGVKVQWCNSSTCFMPKEVDETGNAYYENLEDDQYYVHLLGVPEGYTYNPNIYTPNADNKHVDISLLELSTASLEKRSSDPSSNNRYMYEADKAYEVTVDGTGSFNYLGFNAKKPGIYEIESWAVDKLASNVMDPVFAYYGGEKSYIPANPYEEVDDGGIGKNFKYTFEMGEEYFEHDGNGNVEINADGTYVTGVSHTFAILATATKYPASFTVKLTRVGDVPEPEEKDVEMVQPTATLAAAEEAPSGQTFVRGKLLEGEEVAYYDVDNDVYRRGDINGQIIYAKITKACEFFDIGITGFVSGGTNPFILDNGTKDYTEFVAAYARVCNSDGAYPLNSELKTFFDLLQANQGYFMAPGGWIYSQIDGHYQEGNEWLFPAGYYIKAEGTQDNPYILEETGKATCKVEEGESAYFKLKLDNYLTATITSTNAYACFVDGEGNVYENEDHSGFSATIELSAGYNNFSVRFSNGAGGNIGFSITGTTIYE